MRQTVKCRNRLQGLLLAVWWISLAACQTAPDERALRTQIDAYHAAWAKQDDRTMWRLSSSRLRRGIDVEQWVRMEAESRLHHGLVPVKWEVRSVRVLETQASATVWVQLGFIRPVDRPPPPPQIWREHWMLVGGRWLLDELGLIRIDEVADLRREIFERRGSRHLRAKRRTSKEIGHGTHRHRSWEPGEPGLRADQYR